MREGKEKKMGKKRNDGNIHEKKSRGHDLNGLLRIDTKLGRVSNILM